MKKLTISAITAFMVLSLAFPTFAAQWVKFKPIEKPYYDPQTGEIVDITGRMNRKHIDEFAGGGKIYPDIQKPVLKRHEKNGYLYIKIDAQPNEIQAILNGNEKKTFRASTRKIKEYNTKDFKPELVSDKDIDILFPVPVKSGVTK